MTTDPLNAAGYWVTPHSIGPWVVGILIAALGITALVRERGSPVSRALCLLATSVSVWLLSSGMLYSTLDEPRALLWAKVAHLGVVFIPSTVFLFTLTIVRRLREFRVVAWGSLVVSGAFYAGLLGTDRFISGLYRYRWGYYSRYGPLSVPFLVFFGCLLVASLMLLRAELARSSPGVPRRRVTTLLIALGVGYLGAVDYLGTYGIAVYPFGYVPIMGFAVLMFCAVWRYRLLEITPALAAEQIIDTMADAVLVLDHGGIVRVANQAASQLFGYARVELVGQPVSTALGDLLGRDEMDALAATDVTREHETHYRTRQDKILALGITGSVTRDGAGDPIAFVFVIRDLTERKQLEEQLRQAQRLEALGHLARDIARELEIIVALIAGHGAFLPTGLDQGAAGTRANVEEMRKAADRAAELTRQLLAFSSSQRVKPTLLDLNVLITNLRGVLEWVLGKDIALTIRLDPALGWVMADPGQIEQVIIKLAANAREAMSDGARLTIEAANVRVTPFSPPAHGRVRAGHYVMLAVSASRWLMDEDTQARLFEPSFTKGRGRVTWLDLAMVYGIVKQSGGQIGVTSEREGGTTFRIYLPLTGPADAGPPLPEIDVEDRRPQADATSRA